MNANQCAGTLPIQVKIAHVKLAPSPLQLFFVSAVDRACEPKLRVIRNSQSVVVVLGFDHSDYWSKDFFLLDGVTSFYIRDYGRLDEKSLFTVRAAASQDTTAFSFTFFDIAINRIEGFLIDHRAHVRNRVRRIAHFHFRGALNDLLEHRVIDLRVDDRS